MTVLMRLKAPMASFGGTAVDATRPTDAFPSASLLTGLMANALGYDHSETERLQALQEGLRYAVLGSPSPSLVDYQTADLGQPTLLAPRVAWTTSGQVEHRAGGSAKTGTHIRSRHYLTGVDVLVAVALQGTSEPRVFEALRHPARPLFIGRKCCIPTLPIAVEHTADEDYVGVLLDRRADQQVLWVEASAVPSGWTPTQRIAHRGRKDWANQLHVGDTWWVECRQEAA